MACDIAIGANRGKACTIFQGGNTRFYPFNFIDNAFTVVNGVCTAINPLLTTVYEYVIEGDGNTFTSPTVADKKTGVKVTTQTLVAQLIGIDATTNVELDKLVSGHTSGVLKDRNGKYRWVAKDGWNVTATAEAVTGGATGDFSGYNVTLVAETLEQPPILSDTIVADFLALIA